MAVREKDHRARRGRKKPVQHRLVFPVGHGGRRKGAGRKSKGPRQLVRHARRPELNGREPVLITCRVRDDVPNLRWRESLGVIQRCFAAGNERSDFGIVQYSVQSNHIHVLVEAKNKVALSSALTGLLGSIARKLNRLFGRRGKLWVGRYHACVKRTPTEVRNALLYVLGNGVKHGVVRRGQLDPCSSARGVRFLLATVKAARTWLLHTGWRRAGPLPQALARPC